MVKPTKGRNLTSTTFCIHRALEMRGVPSSSFFQVQAVLGVFKGKNYMMHNIFMAKIKFRLLCRHGPCLKIFKDFLSMAKLENGRQHRVPLYRRNPFD